MTGHPAAADVLPGLDDDTTPPLHQVLEAILLVVDEPVPAVLLAQVTERPRHEVEAALTQTAADWLAQRRGVELRQVAGGWRLYTAPGCAPYVERFVTDGAPARLSQAALETLAIIAYRQPVSRARVAAIRGVSADGVIRTLLARRLVAEAGTDTATQAVLYATTPHLLERLGLDDLSQLPPLAPMLDDDLDGLDT